MDISLLFFPCVKVALALKWQTPLSCPHGFGLVRIPREEDRRIPVGNTRHPSYFWHGALMTGQALTSLISETIWVQLGF